MAKGKGFEWEICRALSYNWTQGTINDDVFCPTDSSGGRATKRRKKGKKTEYKSADIGLAHPIGELLIKHWSMEAKSGYVKKRKTKIGVTKDQWSILDFLDSKQEKPIFEEFWDQCLNDADITQREPILFFRRNNRKACTAIYKSLFNRLNNFFGKPKMQYLIFSSEFGDIIIMNFNEFLEWCHDLKSFIEYLEKGNGKEKI
ncbi:MAG: hypothetical protein RBR32_06660 [Bacteroidales bacterium]|nr:hypothetical protein [Bacteroidales bacterium]